MQEARSPEARGSTPRACTQRPQNFLSHIEQNLYSKQIQNDYNFRKILKRKAASANGEDHVETATKCSNNKFKGKTNMKTNLFFPSHTLCQQDIGDKTVREAITKEKFCQVWWWQVAITPALWRLKQEDCNYLYSKIPSFTKLFKLDSQTYQSAAFYRK